MELSIFIAKIFAVAYAFIGLGMILSPRHYHKMINEVIKGAGILYISGIMATVAGLLIVLYHNIWVSSWVVVITIFGWAALLKGFFLLTFPGTIKIWQGMFKNASAMPIVGIFVLALSLFFGYFGFVA